MTVSSISQPVAGAIIEANRFGRFTVLEQAGAGAMGVVYAAYDPSLDRRVALKVLRGRATAGRRRDAVRREALALARVSHPNVVPIYEVAEADGRLFLAMEYVDGEALDDWLADVQRPWTRIVEVFADLASGLAAAHAQGLVHRDFKPTNVLVGADERPRIIDFGLARAVDGVEELIEDGPQTSGEFARLSVALSRTGRLKGTPAYMAPEQLDGEPPTAASDQFSFCVALFEALTGHPPFPRDSLPLLRNAIAKGSLAEAGAVPKDVFAIVRRGLANDPAARWPSMTALGDALRGALLERATLDRGTRARLTTIGVLVLFALGAFGGLFSDFPATPEEFALLDCVACSLIGGSALLLRYRFTDNAANPRFARVLVGLMIAKLLAMGFCLRLELPLSAVFMADLLVSLAYAWPVSWVLGIDIRLAGFLVVPAVGVGFVVPSAMGFAHSAVMFALAAGFLTVNRDFLAIAVPAKVRQRRAKQRPMGRVAMGDSFVFGMIVGATLEGAAPSENAQRLVLFL